MQQAGAPVMVLNTNTKREHGRKAQLANITAAKTVADIIRTTLGPRSMLKMILDPMGGIVMTNDGNAILREVDVSHPAAKSMIELSRTQDEEVGDGTTSVIIMTGEILSQARPYLERNMHPRIIVGAFYKAMQKALAVMDKIAMPLDIKNRAALLGVVQACIGTKFTSRFGDLMCNIALDAVLTVVIERPDGPPEIDIKRYCRIEKIPGGFLEESEVMKGLLLNKDIIHPRMRRMIKNPRILLLDCPLEYKKGESQTNVEITNDADWETMLKMEEEYIEQQCKAIIKHKPDLVFTEKGVSDLAQHFLYKANISVIRRVRKTDNNRIARVAGAKICNNPEDIKETDLGTECGLFEIKKIGDEYFTYLLECKNPKACTILLRGAGKDVLNEMERNLQDAMSVVRNVVLDPRVLPGGGATEMAIGRELVAESKTIEDIQQWPYRSVASALEVIPRTLVENCGGSTIRLLTALRAKHAEGKGANFTWGIDGNAGEIRDMKELGILDPFLVKTQTVKTAIEAATMLLRIDDIVSGMAPVSRGPQQGGGGGQAEDHDHDQETFGDARDG